MNDFLKHLQQSKTEELNKIQHELLMINEDLLKNEECLANLKVLEFKCNNLSEFCIAKKD